MDNVIERHPFLISEKQISHIINKSSSLKNYSVIRAIARLLSRIEHYSETDLGVLVDQCFEWLSSHETPVATKAHSMQTLFNITTQLPDLKNELKSVIEMQLPYESAGFKSRGKKILAALEKIN